jgi:hypothetical protein
MSIQIAGSSSGAAFACDDSHAELVARAVKWLLNAGGCSIAFTEFSTSALEIPDAIGFKGKWSIVIECKRSRADFFAERKKPFRRRPHLSMGHQRYYMVPDKMISAQEVPEKWGLLYVRGRHTIVVKKSMGFTDRHYTSEIGFLCSMLRRAALRIGSAQKMNEWLKVSVFQQIKREKNDRRNKGFN